MFKNILLESLDFTALQDLPLFADSLMMYTMYNDKDSIDDIVKTKNVNKLFTKPKKLYRVVRGTDETDYIINEFGITSASTKISTAMIQEFKDMISQYKKNGNFYLQEIQQAQGIDINKLNNSFKGKQKELKAQYDTPGEQPMGALFDALKQLKAQNEFLIFGDYKVTKVSKI